MNDEDILSKDALEKLTGWKQAKKQIEQLRKQGIPFYINCRNKPVVLSSVLTGNSTKTIKSKSKWSPSALS